MLGFDMGGTSTDVSRYGGSFEHVFESITAECTIQSPQLDINTVAAGGGRLVHPIPYQCRKGERYIMRTVMRCVKYGVCIWPHTLTGTHVQL